MKESKAHKIHWIQIFICFALPWLLFFLLFLLSKEVYFYWGTDTFRQRLMHYPKQIWFWCNFLPAVFFFCIGLLINYFINNKKPASCHRIILTAFILVGIDQMIQFLVVTYHNSIKISVIEKWLTIIPKSMMESKGEYVSGGQMSILIHLFVSSFGIVLGYFVFRFLSFLFEQNKNHLYMATFFYIVGYVCSFLNMILYKYGYDYIELYLVCIFDLKDVYILLGFFTLLQSMLQNAGVLKKVHLRDLAKYSNHEYQAIKRWFSRKKCKEV